MTVTDLPRRISGVRRTDVLAASGAAVAALSTTALLFGMLLPFSGRVGFVVVAWSLFVAAYALLVSRDEPGPVVRDRVAAAVVHSLAGLVLLPLVLVVGFALWKGAGALRHLNFFTQDLRAAGPTDPLTTGGVAHGIVGTLEQMALALAVTVPLGLTCAVFLNEVPGRFARLVRTVVEAMTALPSIVAGLFVYATVILSLGQEKSGLAAALATCVMMLPVIVRAADVVLRLVPGSLKEASYALGGSQWRTVWHVVLPTARSGLTTAVILGMARGIGETATVLLTAGFTAALNANPFSGPQVTLPLLAFQLVRSASTLDQARGFGAAAVLMALVLILFAAARMLGRARRPGGMRRPRLLRGAAAVILVASALALLPAGVARAASYVPISGAGSTWSQNALDQWRRNINQYGMQVNYQGTGSSDGRNQFRNSTVDFAVSEIPYGLRDGGVVDNPPARKYAYMPIVAGGTSFMYHLKIGGRRVTNLRLSGLNVAKIFTGNLTYWNDPAIKADNPGLALPARRIVPVVRSDGSGTTAQLTTWLAKQYPQLWDGYCAKAGRSTPCGVTSTYPLVTGSGFTAQSGSLGVSGYVAQSQSEGAITYVEYSYAVNTGFPIAKLLNRAGYYTEPTASNVAVALLKARINTDPASPDYLTQILDGVYNGTDPRTYPLSSYSYMVVPTALEGSFNEDKGRTLGAFAYYFLCEGQQQAPLLGYSPLPINLVQAGIEQVKRIPGVDVQTVDIKKCNNPTFSPDGTNTLAKTAPQPQPCDKQGTTQCTTGTSGAKKTPTPVTGGPAPAGSGSTPTGPAPVTGTASSPGIVAGPATATDPDTGQPAPVAAGPDGAGQAAEVLAEPVAVPLGDGTQRGLMAVAALLLLGLVAGPPLLARTLARRDAA